MINIKKVLLPVFNRLPFFYALNEQVRDLNEQVNKLSEKLNKCGAYPAGHYYSPIPSEEDVLVDINYRKPLNEEIRGINLNKESQWELLNEYVQYYDELPFQEEQTPYYRYYYNNGWFSYSDAVFFYSFLRKHMPKKIIEVGSGFSSAVLLDTVDKFYLERPEITFIEPYPDRLNSLLRDSDTAQVRLLDKKIQDIPIDTFLDLESGDLLFIDSSHVVKSGSDLNFVIFDVLPALKQGVFVHFHDVFYPFDYPSKWLMEGRYWNENYFLRAFLSYNNEWSIKFFNTYVNFVFGDFVKKMMPLCVKNHGGSLYLRREKG